MPAQGQARLHQMCLNGPFGATALTYGSGDSDAFSFDNLGHITQYKYDVGSQYYQGTPTWNPNGTLKQLATYDTITGGNPQNNFTVAYNYDDLARVWKAVGGSLNQTYTYDRYGNLTTSGPPYSWNPPYGSGYSASTNQYVSGGNCNGSGVCYDGDGNLTSDTFHSYTWNTEGKLLSVDGGSATVYDAFNRPVEKQDGYEYLYAPGLEKPIAQMSGSTLALATLPLPGGGSVLYTPTGILGYTHSDWNGAVRVTSTQSQTLYSQTEYSPFGVPFDPSQSPCCYFLFDELDYMGLYGMYTAENRQLMNIEGRWISPDPAGMAAVDITNPQSWNRYAYVMNNPTSYVDPTGLACFPLERVMFGSCSFFAMLEGAAFGENWEEFDAMSLPVVAPNPFALPGQANWVPNPDYNPADPNSVIGTYQVSTALVQIGTGADLQSWLSSFKPAVGYSATFIFPVFFGTLGPAITVTYVPGKNLKCVAPGVGASFGRTVSAGPVVGDSGSIEGILKGASFSGGYQLTPWAGAGGSVNSSGVVSGNTIGNPGASATLTYGFCF